MAARGYEFCLLVFILVIQRFRVLSILILYLPLSVSEDIYRSSVIWAQLMFLTKLFLTDSHFLFYLTCSCKSFEYGLGYNSSSRFLSTLYKQGLGQCKLRSVDATTNEMKSCYYDYYEKKPPTSAGFRGLLSSMALYTMLVLMIFMQW